MTKRMLSKILLIVAIMLFGIMSARTIMADNSQVNTAQDGYPPPVGSPEPPISRRRQPRSGHPRRPKMR